MRTHKWYREGSSIELRYGRASHGCKDLVPDATYDLLAVKGEKIVFTGPP